MATESQTQSTAAPAGTGSEAVTTPFGPRAGRRPTVGEIRRLERELREAYGQLRVTEDRLDDLGNTLAVIERSGSFKLARVISAIAEKAATPGTKRRQALTQMLAISVEARADPRLLLSRGPRLAPGDLHWNRFCRRHDPTPARLRRMRELSRTWEHRPLVSILMPTFDPTKRFLRAAIRSVKEQAYERWELCIVDDGSRTNAAARTIAGYLSDPRIRYSERLINGGIAQASQTAADMASGEFITFLDHDDVFRPHALFEMVNHQRTHPECDLIYSDEDRLDPWGRRVYAHLKPDWSPELMDSCNYMCHLTLMTRELFERTGGFRAAFDGSQDYDLFLRAAEQAREIGHVREALYSWRMHEGSAASSPLAKPAAFLAGGRCLEDRLARSGEQGTVVEGAWSGSYHIRRPIIGAPTIGVVIPTRDAVELLRESVACAEREAAAFDVCIVIVDNDSADASTHEYFERCGHLVVPGPGTFNFSRLVNIGAAAAGPVDHILLLNNDVVSARPGWLSALVEHSQRPGIGAVGARLLFDDGTPQHEGIRVGAEGGPAINLDLSRYFGMGLTSRTVSAVTGACLMVKRTLWEEVGGFDEALRVAFNDVDFCLRLMHAGYRNVYTPLAELTHLESATRGRRHPVADERLFVTRWGPFPQGYDPYLGGHIWSFKPLDYR
jgi:GT2 family glycosyltransferase